MRDHRQIDERSLAFGHAIAAHLHVQPDLVEIAKQNLAQWLETATPRSQHALLEWANILAGPLDGVICLLTETNERGVRLRQSNPFAGVLPQSERNAILLQFDDHDPART